MIVRRRRRRICTLLVKLAKINWVQTSTLGRNGWAFVDSLKFWTYLFVISALKGKMLVYVPIKGAECWTVSRPFEQFNSLWSKQKKNKKLLQIYHGKSYT
jgi:hypothetical protein